MAGPWLPYQYMYDPRSYMGYYAPHHQYWPSSSMEWDYGPGVQFPEDGHYYPPDHSLARSGSSVTLTESIPADTVAPRLHRAVVRDRYYRDHLLGEYGELKEHPSHHQHHLQQRSQPQSQQQHQHQQQQEQQQQQQRQRQQQQQQQQQHQEQQHQEQQQRRQQQQEQQQQSNHFNQTLHPTEIYDYRNQEERYEDMGLRRHSHGYRSRIEEEQHPMGVARTSVVSSTSATTDIPSVPTLSASESAPRQATTALEKIPPPTTETHPAHHRASAPGFRDSGSVSHRAKVPSPSARQLRADYKSHIQSNSSAPVGAANDNGTTDTSRSENASTRFVHDRAPPSPRHEPQPRPYPQGDYELETLPRIPPSAPSWGWGDQPNPYPFMPPPFDASDFPYAYPYQHYHRPRHRHGPSKESLSAEAMVQTPVQEKHVSTSRRLPTENDSLAVPNNDNHRLTVEHGEIDRRKVQVPSYAQHHPHVYQHQEREQGPQHSVYTRGEYAPMSSKEDMPSELPSTSISDHRHRHLFPHGYHSPSAEGSSSGAAAPPYRSTQPPQPPMPAALSSSTSHPPRPSQVALGQEGYYRQKDLEQLFVLWKRSYERSGKGSVDGAAEYSDRPSGMDNEHQGSVSMMDIDQYGGDSDIRSQKQEWTRDGRLIDGRVRQNSSSSSDGGQGGERLTQPPSWKEKEKWKWGGSSANELERVSFEDEDACRNNLSPRSIATAAAAAATAAVATTTIGGDSDTSGGGNSREMGQMNSRGGSARVMEGQHKSQTARGGRRGSSRTEVMEIDHVDPSVDGEEDEMDDEMDEYEARFPSRSRKRRGASTDGSLVSEDSARYDHDENDEDDGDDNEQRLGVEHRATTSKIGSQKSETKEVNQKNASSTEAPPKRRRIRVRETKNHYCEQCGKRFSRPSQLLTHSFTHSGERHIRTHSTSRRKSSKIGSLLFRGFALGHQPRQAHAEDPGHESRSRDTDEIDNDNHGSNSEATEGNTPVTGDSGEGRGGRGGGGSGDGGDGSRGAPGSSQDGGNGNSGQDVKVSINDNSVNDSNNQDIHIKNNQDSDIVININNDTGDNNTGDGNVNNKNTGDTNTSSKSTSNNAGTKPRKSRGSSSRAMTKARRGGSGSSR
ncbi:hypothetical protein BGZ94_001195 [Podila epigama]|nr:hypothetical protein BGZ94_001195 [Podila epigama]